ncbi:MAG TPA: kynureninase [Candidatus Eisenbacteria bacterium]|nr:kynureninase [Candidatus Eisenbacteria bacterium]
MSAFEPPLLARHYTRFRVAERLLLTGHSHQAWPDVAFDGQLEAWNDAAELVDEKWGRAADKAERVRRGFARLLGGAPGEIALGQNTHELVLRFLSALPLVDRPRLVSTDGEFHSIRRQLDRLAEDGRLEIVKVPAGPPDAIAERLAAAVNERTSAVLASSVLFGNAAIVPGLGSVAAACRRAGAELLVDAYHHLNVVPFSLRGEALEEAFVVGGGYKYCQLGEGNCFLRVPPHAREYRPVITGWYGEFAHLTDRADARVSYAEGPERWAGATYDPTSHYRAARVFDFFEDQGLTPERLRAISEHQIRLLADGFDALGLDPGVIARDRSIPLERIGGFLALRSPGAEAICAGLRALGVLADVRGDLLRLGPAPYLADEQIERAIAELGRVARA